MPLPLPLPDSEPTTTAVFLLHPRQLSWIRAHSGRRGASSFMRRLLADLIEEERQEIERVKQQLRERREEREQLAA